MDIDQHENFPAARGLLPKSLRAPAGIIYQTMPERAVLDLFDRCVAARSIEGNA